MINNLYMLFDNASQMFIGAITILINDVVALRSFKELAHRPDFPYAGMLDDLNLFKIGTINTGTGEIIFDKRLICNLGSLLYGDKKDNNISDKEA